ncbi:hypothetical protein K5R88_03835 [Pseudomonas sp. MM213]|uniref:hypothetical protein n=1 Tax=Pseudomonas sp. MM213 TaxID=2866807 RepID=UPI001CF5C0CA|nr:hypothetical protein [Pseudomonas sp. MM213]UCP10779.1 hypothetical protein K5R88_03835 [Pseudomonas sp. MM213]
MVHSIAIISGTPPYRTRAAEKAGPIDSDDRKFRCMRTESAALREAKKTVEAIHGFIFQATVF